MVAWLILIVLDFFVLHLFGVGFPDFFPDLKVLSQPSLVADPMPELGWLEMPL